MTSEIIQVFAVLFVTAALFISDRLRVDIIALLIMVTLPWLGLLTPAEALSGLSSNAVVSIIAVMILGHGVDRTGIMNRLTAPILRMAGKSEKRLTVMISGTVGLVSSFMQNIGAAALFLPAIMRISKKSRIPASHLLMPMGFAAILGGTITMIASSPLIILNDLLKHGGERAFGLFHVTPLGIALLGTGLAYFLFFGRWVLPERKGDQVQGTTQQELIGAYGLLSSMYCVHIPEKSRLHGKMLDEISLWDQYNLHVIVLKEKHEVHYVPWRKTQVRGGQLLGVLGSREDVERFAGHYGLQVQEKSGTLLEDPAQGEAGGFAEIMVHPRASIAGKTIREIALRKRYGLEPILHMSGSTLEHHDFSDQKIEPGDTLVVYGYWDRLRALKESRDLVLLTPIEAEEIHPSKQYIAAACFLGGIGLAVAGFPLSISLLTGALAMVLLRVLTMDEAYRAIDWRTVFLLAGLIPLGVAMAKTGAAAYLADGMSGTLRHSHPLLIMTAVALLTTLFSLFMSNVAATVLLVPLVMMMGRNAGIDPRGLALLVAVCASNSFLLPTHQVNALLMSPGGYRNRDYLRAGSFLSLLFIAVSVLLIYTFYLSS